jgi:TctA family transporter
MSLDERNRLLWLTRRGSLIGGVVALLLVWCLYYFYQATSQIFLAKLEIKLMLLYSVIVFLIWVSKYRLITAMIAFFGLLISPQNNYSLPAGWYQLSETFQNTTFFMLILSFLIIPDLIKDTKFNYNNNQSYTVTSDRMPWWLILKNTIVGCLVGLVPGPSAEVAASVAYNTTKSSDVKDKIIAAETANNPGVVMMLLPLLLLGLPFTLSSLIVSNIMDSKMVALPELARAASGIISGITIFDSLILLSLITTIIYYVLSTKFINFYTQVVAMMQGQFRSILILAVAVMLVADIYIQQVSVGSYLILIVAFTVTGIILKNFKINPTPLIFVYLLGDQIVWSTIQFFTIYF